MMNGSDGTVNEAVNGIAPHEKRPKLAIIPMGTGNIILIESIFRRKSVKANRYFFCACGSSEKWIDMKDIPLLEDKFL